MSANSSTHAALDDAARATSEARAAFDQSVSELARRAEKAIQEGVEILRSRGGDYVGDAHDRIETAQRYMTQRVQDKPMTTTLAALGIGVLVGFLLSGGRR